VVDDGTVSRNVTPVASLSPALVTVRSQTRVSPGAPVPEARVLVKESDGDPPTEVVTESQLLAVGSPPVAVLTHAVLTTDVRDAATGELTRTAKVFVALPPAGRSPRDSVHGAAAHDHPGELLAAS
jgi:hypothetical protein